MPNQTGLTLTELLVSLLIIAVLAGLSGPPLQTLMEENKGATAMQDIASSLRQARSAAITSAGIVTVCPSSDGQQCGGHWHVGSLVFTDANGDRVLDESDTLIRRVSHGQLPGTIRWRAFRNRRYLQFMPTGFTRYQNGNFTYCHEHDPRQHRQLILSRTGRLRYAEDTDGDGLRENSRGKPIDCN